MAKGDKKEDKFEAAMTPGELTSEVDPAPLVRTLRREISKYQRQLDKLKLQLGERDDMFSQISEHLATLAPLKQVYKGPNKKSKKRSSVSTVMQVSDWHIGDDVDADEIEGFNAFNFDIAHKRVSLLSHSFMNWVEDARVSNDVDELVIVCQGDMISGDIHDELRRANEFPVPVQIPNAAQLFSTMVRDLAPHFKKVRIEYIVADNHSRLTVKNQWKRGGLNSYNYTVGWIAQEMLKDVPNLEFILHPVVKTVIKVQNMNYLVEHGHTIQGWSGFPWYGADRATAREAKSRKFTEHQFHRMLIGHFHVPMNAEGYIVNGSLTGTTEYDHSAGRNAKPAQNAWLVHPVNGEYNWTPFKLHTV
jgi:hypothetical protein